MLIEAYGIADGEIAVSYRHAAYLSDIACQYWNRPKQDGEWYQTERTRVGMLWRGVCQTRGRVGLHRWAVMDDVACPSTSLAGL